MQLHHLSRLFAANILPRSRALYRNLQHCGVRFPNVVRGYTTSKQPSSETIPPELWTPPDDSRRFSLNQKKAGDEKEDDDEASGPVKYSERTKWHAGMSMGKPREAPWYQSYSIAGSLGAFLLYFLVLREENSIDDRLYQPLPIEKERLLLLGGRKRPPLPDYIAKRPSDSTLK